MCHRVGQAANIVVSGSYTLEVIGTTDLLDNVVP